MRLLARVGSLRAVVAVTVGFIALNMLIVVFGNITDYGTNEAFVRHVLAMDTTFGEGLKWRAITSPAVVTLVYVLIIAWEAVSAVLLTAGTIAYLRGREDSARSLASAGLLMVVALFLGGFMTIGGEWFAMWQSQDWNGIPAALRMVTVAGFALVLVHLTPRRATA
ncbi:Predicted small integral membrane protein [Lentzea xinjiangensis]|uniref:Predicted small integral membrane protein n=1 Tax=Lentzea xinjiangensis TaxID=402600 RepID=A0A1H9E7I6_9PSEU|nr:DUF2165 domain-containing protein [Lentzea xinjiangensis]SEQ21597.1 Predicted small integral membrane protein [Lentzea xinjiangensis]